MLTANINSTTNSVSENHFSLKVLILYYFNTFLLIDLLNGFVLKYLGIEPAISPGQIVRGVITLFLALEILLRKTANQQNKHIYLFGFFAPISILFYYLRDHAISAIPLEIIAIIKPLFFLLLFHQVSMNYSFYKSRVDQILFSNMIVFTTFIIGSFVTGVGVNAYSGYYESSKSFFYGANPTAILGFVLSIYYTYQIKEKSINLIYLLAILISLYLSGTQIILVYPFFLLYFLLFKVFSSRLYKSLTIISFLLISLLFTSGFLNKLIFSDNALISRYGERALHSVNYFNEHSQIKIIPLRWYSWVSGTRAYRADLGLRQMQSKPSSYLIGYGNAMKSKMVGESYAGRTGSEMDLIDLFLDYGIIGLIFIYLPIFKTIIPIIANRDTNRNAMLIYFLILYSSFAGHVITAPMGSTLFALFLGIEYCHYNQIKENSHPDSISHLGLIN